MRSGTWEVGSTRHFPCSPMSTKHVKLAITMYLHNLSCIRKYLDKKTTECLVHAFITSLLDYCNSLLYGLPDWLISKLQRVQNAAARLVYKTPRFCHTSPILQELHWLPIRDRIKFKVILIIFRQPQEPHQTIFRNLSLLKAIQVTVLDPMIHSYLLNRDKGH